MGGDEGTHTQAPRSEAGASESASPAATPTPNVSPVDGPVDEAVAGKPKSLLKTVHTATSIAVSVVTAIAIIVGGWWTWSHFDNTAALKPDLVIGESVKATRLTDDMVYLFVSISLQNASQRTLYIPCGDVWIYRIVPLTDNEEARLREHATLVTDNPTVAWHSIKYVILGNGRGISEHFYVEANGTAQVPLDLIISSKKGDPKSEIRTIMVELVFQRGDGPGTDCRRDATGTRIIGNWWPHKAVLDLR